MKIGIGLSTRRDALLAGKEAWDQAKAKIGKEKIDFAMLFSSIDLSTFSLLKAIKNNLGGQPLIGCSSQAIITNSGIHNHAAILILINGEGVDISVAFVKDIKTKTAYTAGEELGNKLLQDFRGIHRELGIFFCDGLIEEGSKLISGLQERLGISFPIVGASASDNLRFYKTYLYFNQEILSDAAVGILLGGRLKFGLGIKHGWKPLGKFRTVTASSGNIVERIDNKPAVNIYREYFAKDIAGLKKELKYISTLYPIGLYIEGEEEYLLRNILSIEGNGSLICQGDIPVGSQIRLMIGNKEFCLAATRQAVDEAKQSLLVSRLGLQRKDSVVDLLFVFDSISRHTLLKRSAIEELKIIKRSIGEGVPIVGFYTYGEQAPLKSMGHHGRAHFHNQTISILALGG
jgi:hypothetical protein